MSALSPAQAARLLQACQQAGIRTQGLKAINPWSLTTRKAAELQSYIQEVDPVLAAELSADFTTPSLEMAALQHRLTSGEEVDFRALSPDLQTEYAQRNPEVVAAMNEKAEKDLLAKWDAEAREMAAKRGIDLDAKRAPQGWQERFFAQQQALKDAGL